MSRGEHSHSLCLHIASTLLPITYCYHVRTLSTCIIDSLTILYQYIVHLCYIFYTTSLPLSTSTLPHSSTSHCHLSSLSTTHHHQNHHFHRSSTVSPPTHHLPPSYALPLSLSPIFMWVRLDVGNGLAHYLKKKKSQDNTHI